MKRAALPPGHPEIAATLHYLAAVYKAKGEYDRALPLYEEALKIVRKALPPGHPDITTCLNSLVKCYESMGRHEARQVRAGAERGGAVA
jgi:tetratricopeptide (TPR) repeat protein